MYACTFSQTRVCVYEILWMHMYDVYALCVTGWLFQFSWCQQKWSLLQLKTARSCRRDSRLSSSPCDGWSWHCDISMWLSGAMAAAMAMVYIYGTLMVSMYTYIWLCVYIYIHTVYMIMSVVYLRYNIYIHLGNSITTEPCSPEPWEPCFCLREIIRKYMAELFSFVNDFWFTQCGIIEVPW